VAPVVGDVSRNVLVVVDTKLGHELQIGLPVAVAGAVHARHPFYAQVIHAEAVFT